MIGMMAIDSSGLLFKMRKVQENTNTKVNVRGKGESKENKREGSLLLLIESAERNGS